MGLGGSRGAAPPPVGMEHRVKPDLGNGFGGTGIETGLTRITGNFFWCCFRRVMQPADV